MALAMIGGARYGVGQRGLRGRMSPLSPSLSIWIDSVDARWPGARRRVVSVGLALLIEALLLLVLLSLGAGAGQDGAPDEVVATFDIEQASPEPERQQAEPPAAAPRQQASARPVPPQAAASPSPLSSPPAVVLPRPATAPEAPPAPPATTAPAAPKIKAVIRSDMATARGPAGNAGASGDSQRIAGSGPNGEPLYAAQWYREPYRDELTGYLDYVNPPAWALIDCRTEPQFRVDGCVLVDEWPQGSNMGRAVLAAAWQFKVRPPRVGGRSMVGEWVRIRIDYTVTRK